MFALSPRNDQTNEREASNDRHGQPVRFLHGPDANRRIPDHSRSEPSEQSRPLQDGWLSHSRPCAYRRRGSPGFPGDHRPGQEGQVPRSLPGKGHAPAPKPRGCLKLPDPRSRQRQVGWRYPRRDVDHLLLRSTGKARRGSRHCGSLRPPATQPDRGGDSPRHLRQPLHRQSLRDCLQGQGRLKSLIVKRALHTGGPVFFSIKKPALKAGSKIISKIVAPKEVPAIDMHYILNHYMTKVYFENQESLTKDKH